MLLLDQISVGGQSTKEKERVTLDTLSEYPESGSSKILGSDRENFLDLVLLACVS